MTSHTRALCDTIGANPTHAGTQTRQDEKQNRTPCDRSDVTSSTPEREYFKNLTKIKKDFSSRSGNSKICVLHRLAGFNRFERNQSTTHFKAGLKNEAMLREVFFGCENVSGSGFLEVALTRDRLISYSRFDGNV